MEITARLIKKFSTEQVTEKLQKRIIVVQTDGEYQKDIAFSLLNDKCSLVDSINMNEMVKVKFDISSREHNGKYYTEAKAFGVTKV